MFNMDFMFRQFHQNVIGLDTQFIHEKFQALESCNRSCSVFNVLQFLFFALICWVFVCCFDYRWEPEGWGAQNSLVFPSSLWGSFRGIFAKFEALVRTFGFLGLLCET